MSGFEFLTSRWEPASRRHRGVAVAAASFGLLVTLLAVALLLADRPVFHAVDRVELETEEQLPEQLLTEARKSRVRGIFIVIDTAANRLYLRRGEEILLEAPCSTGSGLHLVAGDKKWTFQTPRGAFRVISRTENPIWRKPDWAFLEEGEPPPENEGKRFERGVLGDYAFGIGNGYFIHGTLYSRLLGKNVTHGCIRLGEEDLEVLARRVPIGTRVFIF